MPTRALTGQAEKGRMPVRIVGREPPAPLSRSIGCCEHPVEHVFLPSAGGCKASGVPCLNPADRVVTERDGSRLHKAHSSVSSARSSAPWLRRRIDGTQDGELARATSGSVRVCIRGPRRRAGPDNDDLAATDRLQFAPFSSNRDSAVSTADSGMACSPK